MGYGKKWYRDSIHSKPVFFIGAALEIESLMRIEKKKLKNGILIMRLNNKSMNNAM